MKVFYDHNYQALKDLKSKVGGHKLKGLIGVFDKICFYDKPKIIFKSLIFNHHIIAKNFGMNYSYNFTQLGHLKPNDKVRFDARLGNINEYLRDQNGNPIAQYRGFRLIRPVCVKLLNVGKRGTISSNKVIVAGYSMLKSGKLSKDTVKKDPDFIRKYTSCTNRKTGPQVSRLEANDIIRKISVRAITETMQCICDINGGHIQKIPNDEKRLGQTLHCIDVINDLPDYGYKDPSKKIIDHHDKESPITPQVSSSIFINYSFYNMMGDPGYRKTYHITNQNIINAYNRILNALVYVANNKTNKKK